MGLNPNRGGPVVRVSMMIAAERNHKHGHGKYATDDKRGANVHAVAFLGSLANQVSLIGLVDFRYELRPLAD